MTKAAATFLRILENRAALFASKETDDTYCRGLYAGWKGATEAVLREAPYYFEEAEKEAALVPQIEEDFGSLRERLMAEEMA